MLFELVSTVIFVFSEFVKGDYFRERTNFTIVRFVLVVFFPFPHGCVKVKGRFLLFDALTVYAYT